IGVIERVLQHSGNAVIVFGGHEDVAVEPGDLLLPALGHRILRRHPGVRSHFIEERHRVVAQIDDLGLDIVALFGDVLHPLRRLVAETGSAGGADDDRDLEFGHGDVTFRYVVTTLYRGYLDDWSAQARRHKGDTDEPPCA